MIFASNNEEKINEFKTIFNDIDIISLKDINIKIDILENGNSFFDNALIKAKTIYSIVKTPVIADDSGLLIEGLDNWPGIHTKRIGKNDDEVNKILLEKTKNLKNKNIKAVCVLVYYDGNNIYSSTGTLSGTITNKIYKGNGFGFDQIFRLDNKKVVSQLPKEEKNKLSARFDAICKLKIILKEKKVI